MITFSTLDEFYADRPERRMSREADYGVMWTSGRRWPQWRVSYIKDTGEIYAAELRRPFRVRVLGVVPPDEPRRRHLWYRTLDHILDGWAEQPTFDLSWIERRLASAVLEAAARPEASS